MGSVKRPAFYDPAAMASIRAAFRDVWEELHQQDATRLRPCEATELQVAIINRLMELVSNGTTSPEELKAQVLRNLPLR